MRSNEAASSNIVFGHGARHLQGTNLSPSRVEMAIRQDITVRLLTGSKIPWKNHISVDGVKMEYRAKVLDDGLINVGTYFIIK